MVRNINNVIRRSNNYGTVSPIELKYCFKYSLCMISYLCFSDTTDLRCSEIKI